MIFSSVLRKALAFAAAIGFATSAASASAETDGIVRLQPGEFRIYTFRANEPLMVGFSVEEESEVALKCQGWRADPENLKFPNCAGVFESDGRRVIENGIYAIGTYGAGVGFTPKNGQIVVALKNISKIPLDLSIKARPLD